MGKVIICASQKGGVGKTSTATALASIFAQRGYRTLIIDCDQQCNTTDTYRAESIWRYKSEKKHSKYFSFLH